MAFFPGGKGRGPGNSLPALERKVRSDDFHDVIRAAICSMVWVGIVPMRAVFSREGRKTLSD